MKERRITTVREIAQLTPEEFKRFLPDLAAWHVIAHDAEKIGMQAQGMVWLDDGKPGSIEHIDLTVGDKTARFAFPEGGAK